MKCLYFLPDVSLYKIKVAVGLSYVVKENIVNSPLLYSPVIRCGVIQPEKLP